MRCSSASKAHFRERISPPSVKGALPLQGKVEICGVNTAKLPVLKNEETQALLRRARAVHAPDAPMLTGWPRGGDQITDRTGPSLRAEQTSLFDNL